MLDQNPPRNRLYNTFVLPQTTEQNNMIHDIEVEGSTSRNNYYTKNNNSQNRYSSTFRDRFSYDKNNTPPQHTRSRYDK